VSGAHGLIGVDVGEAGNNIVETVESTDTNANAVSTSSRQLYANIALNDYFFWGGRANYRLNNLNGQLIATFELSFTWSPNTTYAISIDSIFIDKVTTDAAGKGLLKYSSDPVSGQKPFPVSFPTVVFNSLIVVGDGYGGRFNEWIFV
jgi:hypothetical protein